MEGNFVWYLIEENLVYWEGILQLVENLKEIALGRVNYKCN